MRATGISTQPDGQTQFWGTVIDEGGNFGLLEAAPSTCSVDVDVPDAGDANASIRARITNTGDEPIDGWTLAWHLGDGQWVTDASGATVDQDGTHIAATPTGRSATIEPGDDVTLRFTVATNGAPVESPEWFALDGVRCTID